MQQPVGSPLPPPQFAPPPRNIPDPSPGSAPTPVAAAPVPTPEAPFRPYQTTPNQFGSPTPPSPESPTSSGRRGLWVALAIGAVALVVGLGAVLVNRDSDSNSSPGDKVESAESYSLAAAARTTNDAPVVAYDMTMSNDGFETTINGRFDRPTNRAQIDTEMSGISATLIYDMDANTVYMSSDSLPIGSDKWASFDISDTTGIDESLIGADDLQNPLDVSALFEQADQVTELGDETINGRATKHYEVTLDTADVLDQMPAYAQQVTADMPDEIVYQVYVTEDNEFARVAFDIDMPNVNELSTVIDVEPLDSAEPIELPPADDVINMADFMGG